MLKNACLLVAAVSAFLVACLAVQPCYSGTLASDRQFFDMSLEQLINTRVAVPAAMTSLSRVQTPVAVTVISTQDIENSPARNIYDLIETYVPGAFWLNHEEGPHPAVRGSVINRNYKYLLLVNGKVMNNLAHFGAKSELEAWDLQDIRQIEFVRGPGSVTYGPGAVAGVIKIETHTAASKSGVHSSGNYLGKYKSLGYSMSYGHTAKHVSMFAHLSIQRTEGFAPNHFLVSRDNDAGFIGRDYDVDEQAMEYFSDYDDAPQIKFHFDTEIGEKWRGWFRYTQQGSTWRGNEVKSNFDGNLVNLQGTRDRQWTLNFEYENALSNTLSMRATTSVDSYDTERRTGNVRNSDQHHPQNKRINFSEDQWFVSSTLNWQPNASFELATGLEFSRERFGPGWGDDENDVKLGDGGNLVSSIDADAYRFGINNPIFIGDGWYASTYSVLAEANVKLSEYSTILLSGRGDRNSYSNTLYSPRIAFIQNINHHYIVKALVQRSRRLNTAAQNYTAHLTDSEPSDESLTSYELVFESHQHKNGFYRVSVFKNDAEVIGWDGDENMSMPVGNHRLLGAEVEAYYGWNGIKLRGSYSIVKQRSWSLLGGLTRSGISYSDYNQEISDGNIQTGVGNDINNWFNQSLKLNMTWSIRNNLTLHADALYFWDYQGGKDGLTGLQNAFSGSSDEQAINRSIDIISENNAYEDNFRLSLSLRLKLSGHSNVSLHFHNLLSNSGEYKRYSYDSGNDDAAPRRVRYIEEPMAVGIRFSHGF